MRVATGQSRRHVAHAGARKQLRDVLYPSTCRQDLKPRQVGTYHERFHIALIMPQRTHQARLILHAQHTAHVDSG